MPTEFDVSAEPLPPSQLEYSWTSRFIGVPVKKLSVNETFIPSARMGSFLTGLNLQLAKHELADVRNLCGSTESPPVHRTLQLGPQKSDDFLVDGVAFYRSGDGNFALAHAPCWGGIELRLYTAQTRRSFGKQLLSAASDWARENNFLKGEAFSLGGDFLDRTSEGWNDVFLEERNKSALRRAIDRLNGKGKDFPNRGMILTGPPGTGKTLSSRIIRNTADATFIWVSARDFHYAGSFGGVAFGFELAKELAPSVLCFEDVDNWLYETTIDLIKTEMDGIARSSGVLTVLTTNFPERLPAALIDRPGRFHDVLHFGLPDSTARKAMLIAWLGSITDDVVKQTDGYSGAHLYELAQFAKSLEESEGLTRQQAIREAIRKVAEQRDLITAVQAQGSHYRPRKSMSLVKRQLGIKTVGFELALPRVPELHVGIAEAGTYADLVRAGKMG